MFLTDIGGGASTKKSFQLHNACMYLPSARCLLLQSRALLLVLPGAIPPTGDILYSKLIKAAELVTDIKNDRPTEYYNNPLRMC